MKKNLVLLCAFSVLAPARLHAGFDLVSVNSGDPAISDGAAPAAPDAPAPKEWTIMVFMNGKSNIESFAVRDLNRIETAGSSDRVNIVAELGRSRGLDGDTEEDGDWTGVRRYLVTKDQDPGRITSPVLMDLGAADMGDYREVSSFVKWAKTEFPAKRYMLIIWDHGWGWIDPISPAAAGAKSISHDFTTGNYIKTTELGRIFSEAGKVDLYASMACFMQMAEVAYELRNGADIIVGSEEVIQLPSLNFEDFLSYMLAEPGASAPEAGVKMAETFREMYARPEYSDMLDRTKYGAQLSVIRSAALPAFAEKAAAWARLAEKSEDIAALRKAKTGVLRFEVGDEVTDPDKQISFYGDLYDFIEVLNPVLDPQLAGAEELKTAGEELQSAISAGLVLKNVHLGKDRTGKDYRRTHGIAVHIPGRPGDLIDHHPSYTALAFDRATGWKRLIDHLESVGY